MMIRSFIRFMLLCGVLSKHRSVSRHVSPYRVLIEESSLSKMQGSDLSSLLHCTHRYIYFRNHSANAARRTYMAYATERLQFHVDTYILGVRRQRKG